MGPVDPAAVRARGSAWPSATCPGSIIVNQAGRRYANEAAPYVDAVHAMYDGEAATGISHVPSWMVLDQRYRNRYLFAGLGPRQPFPGRWYKSGAIVKADTLEELAERIGVDPAGLAETVPRFNEMARTGVDEDFHRGDSAYDKYYGDPTVKPNPSLGPIDQAPFYAVKMVPGDLGTKGGVVTDPKARALRPDGSVIEGLYAAGNASAAVMGHTYAGAGATIGPAMTFGYIAALDIAERARTRGPVPTDHRVRESELSMPIDPEKAVGAALPDRTFAWTSSDVLLYHLALGAGSRPGDQTDPDALRYTLDDEHLQVLPSFGIVAPTFHETDPPGLELPGCDIDLAQVLHGSQEIEVHGPLPTAGARRRAHQDHRRVGQGQGGRDRPGGHRRVGGRHAAVHDPVEHLRPRRGRLGRRPRPVVEGRAARPRSGRGHVVHHDSPAGAALPAVRRPQPAARRPGVRRGAPASPRRSCTGCAPTASCCASSSTRCSTPTRPGCAASAPGSPGWSSPARRSGSRPGTRATASSSRPPSPRPRPSATARRCSPTACSRRGIETAAPAGPVRGTAQTSSPRFRLR